MQNVQNDATSGGLELDQVEDAILARWQDPSENDQEVSDNETEEAATDVNEEEETQDDLPFDDEDEEEAQDDLEEKEDSDDQDIDDQDETEDESDDDRAVDIDDETEVEVSVNGETHSISIGRLKRLAGQEASLTQKSQDVARQRKDAEDAINRSHVVLQKLINDAEERAKPYADIDMLVASKTMDAEDFAQLRKEASDAESNLKFVREEADTFYQDLQKQQQSAQQEAARDAVKVLQEQIPEWSNTLYNDIRSYAVAQGLPQEQVDQYVDPIVIQLLNKARLFDQGKRVATVKKKAAKKKVLRSKKAPANAESRQQVRKQKAVDNLSKTRGHDYEDIADAILQRWES